MGYIARTLEKHGLYHDKSMAELARMGKARGRPKYPKEGR